MLVVGLVAVGGASAQTPAEEHVPGRLLVQRAAGASDAAVEQAITVFGAKVHHTIEQIGVSVLEVPDPALDAVTQALKRTGLFTFVERDYLAHAATTPNDPDFASQWHLTKIQAPNAWGLTTGSANVPIAVIDSGADGTHPDLAPKLIAGWSFLTGTSNTSDVLGHGTAVAGTAGAATNNLTGVAGVGWANTIMPLVVLSSSDFAYYSDIASAINYAADHGVRVINISIAGSSASSTLQSAVNYAWNKGTVIFAAAGNYSTSALYYPAACTNVVAVSSTEPGDTFSSFSNYGSWITLSAPGDSILTTSNGGGYASWGGTSFASPVAAGVAALVLSVNPSLTASALVALLKQNSDDLGAPGFDPYFGWGRVNAYKAVAAAKGVAIDTTAPTASISSPLAGAAVSGTAVLVSGTATDNVGVTKVEFYVDGGLYASGTAAAFSFSWNSTTKANGSHTLMAKAYDAAGNAGSASVAVTVSNADTTLPTVTISSPLAGAAVSGTAVLVSGTATDNVGVTKVEFYVDGGLYASGTAAAFSFSWNSTTKANGSHTLMAKAYDAANNTGSASMSVNVSNTASTSTQPLLQIKADATEVSGVANGSIVTPAIGPAGFTGKVAVNGTGSVQFTPAKVGNGVYFLNCCSNTNNAYYQFSGTPIGNIFQVNQGQISFYLKSRYSFAQRQTSAAAPRYAFDVRDGNGKHLFFFLTQVTSGYLQFTYATGGTPQYYYVPLGTEDTLFGSAVILGVTLSWNGSSMTLSLNGKAVKTTSYTTAVPNWTSASNFNIGAYEYGSYGYYISDDITDEFTVN